MGLMDKLKEKANEVLEQAEEKAKTVAGDKISQTIDRVKPGSTENPGDQESSGGDSEDSSN